MEAKLVTIQPGRAHAPLLDAFHRGIYWDAFHSQYEPLAVWRRALRGALPYKLTIRLALDGREIVGGIAYERYPRSGCGLVTYLVVAPRARRAGLGQRLLTVAVGDLLDEGAPAVFGEINDPRRAEHEPAEAAWARVERNQRWGARVLEARYIQPALGPGLARDRGLLLVALAGAAPLPGSLDGAIARGFLEELYLVTEGGAPDPEVSVPERVALVELRR